MTAHPTPPTRLLLTAALLLTAGIAVLTLDRHGATTTPHERPALSNPAAPRTPARARPAGQPPATATRPPEPSSADTSPQQLPNGLPLTGEGPAGDPAIQHVLDGASPADLPETTARYLVDLAARIWLAETTGTGRERWPTYFADETLRAPYRDVRVQAAIARRGDHPGDRAVVRLVWAGTSALGETQDGRPATILFEQDRNEWMPVR
ncbi:hypothetical protein ABZ135_31225 [Streptomyces sp. NPDC006339]|uniref:hypothetical protein n=1 Tax=Streptomyces sp. NPDC006339 TaxID=3156755 RepID=UPI0033A8AE2E